MKLSDIMGAAGLAVYAEIALALFVLAFVLVAINIMWKKNQRLWEQARFMPLDEDRDPGPEPRRSSHAGGTKP